MLHESENSQESPHLGEIKRIVNNVYQVILSFSSARDEASILVCDDYLWQSWVEIEHYFKHITTFEALLHKIPLGWDALHYLAKTK